MKNLILFIFLLFTLSLSAQNVGVGTNTPDPSAKLEIDASNAGILIPRVNITSATDATTIPSPATGLMIWNPAASFGSAGFYYNTGTSASPNWVKIIDSSSSVNDADSVVGNEYNTGASLSGTTLSITDGGGSQTVNLSSLQDGVNDADSNPANEFNTNVTLTGTTLNVIDGGGTESVNLSSLVNDADAVVGNEYNTGATLSGTTLSITDGGGSQTVNLSSLQDGVNDADSNPANEFNTNVTLTGTTLNVIDGGGTKSQDLSSLRDHDWYESTGTTPANAIADNIYTQGNVAIGKTNATQKLDVAGNIKLDDNIMVEGNSTARIYRNLVTYSGGSGSAGVFIINTQMDWNAACMFSVDVEGYFYDSSAPFKTKIGAYMYVNNDFVNTGFTNTGAKVLNVRLGRNAAGKVAIVLGSDGSSYSYPKISVTSFLQSHANIIETRADGWTITRAPNTSGLTFVTNVPDVTRMDADGVVGNEYNTGATLSGTTLNITDGGGTQSVNLSSLVNDGDAVVGNEYNTAVALYGTTLVVSDGGGAKSVSLASLAAGDNLGNHTATTTLNLATNNITNVNNLSTRALSSYDKLRVWSSGDYTMGMNNAMTFGYLNDYAMTFTMNNDSDRGFIWRDASDAKSDGAMSLTTDGRLTVKSLARFNYLSGSGNRNVVADASGVLRIEGNSFYETGSRNASYASGQTSWCTNSGSNNGGPSNTRTNSVLTVTNNSGATKIFRVFAVVAAKADDNTDDFEHWIDDGPTGAQYYDKQETKVWPWGGNNTGTNTRYTHLENEYYYTIGSGSSITFRHRARVRAGGCAIIKSSGYMVAYPVN